MENTTILKNFSPEIRDRLSQHAAVNKDPPAHLDLLVMMVAMDPPAQMETQVAMAPMPTLVIQSRQYHHSAPAIPLGLQEHLVAVDPRDNADLPVVPVAMVMMPPPDPLAQLDLPVHPDLPVNQVTRDLQAVLVRSPQLPPLPLDLPVHLDLPDSPDNPDPTDSLEMMDLLDHLANQVHLVNPVAVETTDVLDLLAKTARMV